MIRLLAALSLALTVLHVPATSAAELVYVEAKGCSYCIRFNREMAPAYSKSELGQEIPLRPVNLLRRWPADLKRVDRPPYTPVFILVEDGREVGRFLGYSTPRKFSHNLHRLLKKYR